VKTEVLRVEEAKHVRGEAGELGNVSKSVGASQARDEDGWEMHKRKEKKRRTS
jgi:hypothetical protein